MIVIILVLFSSCCFPTQGLLMVGGGMSDDEDQSHLALWAIMATKLLISGAHVAMELCACLKTYMPPPCGPLLASGVQLTHVL